uniref:C2H2-type domain-containing protein n=1 Tax=Schistocephalus solidus TaxID=70667 RepID=A0A0X3PXA7_SCHSO
MAFFSMQSPSLQQPWGGNWTRPLGEAITAATASSMPSIFQVLRSSFEAGNTQTAQQLPNVDDAIQKQLCATSLLQQALIVLSKKMDYLESGISFDRMMDPNPAAAVVAAATAPSLPGFGCTTINASSHGPTSLPPTAKAFNMTASGESQLPAPQFDCSPQWFPLSLTLADNGGIADFSPPASAALHPTAAAPFASLLPPNSSTVKTETPSKVSSCEKFSIPHLLGYSSPPPPPRSVEEVVPSVVATTVQRTLSGRLTGAHFFKCSLCARSYATRLGLLRHQEHCSRQNERRTKASGDCPLDMTYSPNRRDPEPDRGDTEASATTEGDLAGSASALPSRVADRQYTCHICSKVYFSMSALKMHIRTHTLPCKCTVCGKAFSRMWLLNGHLRTHTGEKPFACRVCQRAFADRSNLRAHMQTHSEEKKYRCGDCGKTFSRMGLLTKHRLAACGNHSPGDCTFDKTPSSDAGLALLATNSTNSSSAEENELLSSPPLGADPSRPTTDRPDPDAFTDFWTAPLSSVFEQTCTEVRK